MTTFRTIGLALVSIALDASAADPLPIRDALARADVRGEFALGIGNNQILLAIRNDSSEPLDVAIPAGSICEASDQARFVLLQDATLHLAPRTTAEALLPSAELSSKLIPAKRSLHLTTATEPRIEPLLKQLKGQPDVPRSTTQLAILCILEDLTFAKWEQFLAVRRPAEANPEPHPTPTEVAEAIDVIGLLRRLDPGRTFALATDAGLKLRALRNPACRAKAMQLYGIDLGAESGAFVAPDISQLLHLKTGDNCPICRERERMQKAASDF